MRKIKFKLKGISVIYKMKVVKRQVSFAYWDT